MCGVQLLGRSLWHCTEVASIICKHRDPLGIARVSVATRYPCALFVGECCHVRLHHGLKSSHAAAVVHIVRKCTICALHLPKINSCGATCLFRLPSCSRPWPRQAAVCLLPAVSWHQHKLVHHGRHLLSPGRGLLPMGPQPVCGFRVCPVGSRQLLPQRYQHLQP